MLIFNVAYHLAFSENEKNVVDVGDKNFLALATIATENVYIYTKGEE